jgi:aminoglycoside phosphotransferase (APT) family kinase protein
MPPPSFSRHLLDDLRARLDRPRLDFSEPPSPISGGFDTQIFAFRLRDAPAPFAGPLILRMLGPGTDPSRVLRERAVQNAVAALGYPAPRVVHATTDTTALGGAFLVMERVPGRVLPEARLMGMSAVLVEWQHRLHALEAEAVLKALDAETPRGRAPGTFAGHLADLDGRTRAPGLEGLRPICRWLIEHHPAAEARQVICHGDLHPLNILVDGGRVTGVLDWPNAIVADAAYDVAATRVILAYAPVDLAGLPVAARWLARGARRLMVHRYVSGYRARKALDARALSYYEVAACMRALVRVAETRVAGTAQTPERARLESSAFTDALLARGAELTGLTPALPPSR